ncbi:MAG: hypothetical protein LBR64_01685 [Dysgonamonadaceae bacterium]|jgi:hypothetical protein|nr:hypothetical protein [Dysgonamonadaceae bacterium]
MKKKCFLLLSVCLMAGIIRAQVGSVNIDVDANTKIATVTKYFNGTNIEDLNNQTNGGLLSQLIHGEAFEENIDPDFLNLSKGDYSKVYVVLDERRIPHLLSQANIYTRLTWNNLNDKYDFNSKDIYSPSSGGQGMMSFSQPVTIGDWKFNGRFLVYDSLPPNIQRIMLERINGNEQISKYWTKLTAGNPQFKYTLERDGQAYMGRQTQVISFTGGSGEVGLINKGLYKQGIRFDANKPYDGVLRIKAAKPTTINLSLRDENGKVLAEKPYSLKGDGSYEKVEYELTPNGSTIKGSFGVSLKSPGEIRMGYAFLQPGKWGRIEGGWPIRSQFTDALKRQGILAFRYNGSMVDVGADTYLYRWKKMIGPLDERRVSFRNGFNPYATHSFGFIEMLQAAEAIGATAIIGMCMDESYEDIRDFVEYCNGPVTSTWGALRAKHGHPQPYNLRYIQVDNERQISRGYVECMKKFAQAAWESDPQVSIMASLNIGGDGYIRGGSAMEKMRLEQLERQLQEAGGPMPMGGGPQSGQFDRQRMMLQMQYQQAKQQIGESYALASEMIGWFIAQGKGDKVSWDPHYSGQRNFADGGDRYLNEMGITLQRELAKDYPGYHLALHPMEENGSRCDWDRGLAHAHNWNTNQRYGDSFVMLGTANTFQPHGLHYMWDQGRIHYTADTIWFQPSAYVDEIMMQTWKPNVVQAGSSEETTLDVTAKLSDKKDELSIYVVNLSDHPQDAVINVANFKFKSQAQVITLGDCDLTEYNTYDNMNNVSPKYSKAVISSKNAKYTFPRYSYTVITLKK